MSSKKIVLPVLMLLMLGCLALVSAQRKSPLGGRCHYTTDCTSMTGIVCGYDRATRTSVCMCEDFHTPSEDRRECLKDIGAPCTSHDECTLQYKYQTRTCGPQHVCECSGNGDCGEGRSQDY